MPPKVTVAGRQASWASAMVDLVANHDAAYGSARCSIVGRSRKRERSRRVFLLPSAASTGASRPLSSSTGIVLAASSMIF